MTDAGGIADMDTHTHFRTREAPIKAEAASAQVSPSQGSRPHSMRNEEPSTDRSTEEPTRVLLADDDPQLRMLFQRWLEREGFHVVAVGSAEACLERLQTSLADAIVMDVGLPGMDGMTAMRRIVERHPTIPVIMATGDSSTSLAVEAIKDGAYDYIVKPVDKQRLLRTIANAAASRRDRIRLRELQRHEGVGYEKLVGDSPPMQRLFRQLDRVADSDVTVLVQGESGSGKELVAAALHGRGSRCDGPFVAVNSAAIPESLQESELFGHERGAFTGATTRRIGRFEEANGGTLFLDEVADLSPSLQVKLLRVLQERTFRRVGGDRDLSSDFRLISASHKELQAEVDAGRLREDLYYRLAVFELHVPSLRERPEDVARLAHHFLGKLARARGAGIPAPNLGQDALSAMMSHDWPGNVRELQNAMQHAFVLADSGTVHTEHLPGRLRKAVAKQPAQGAEPVEGSFGHTHSDLRTGAAESNGEPLFNLDELERRTIVQCLEHTEGNLSEACRLLGCARTTLYRKIQKYSL